MDNSPFLTVFTPVYNRKHLIGKLYNSLKNQTNKDFEWLIIDDGSTDEIDITIKEMQTSEQEFSIRYFFQKNSGKHVAINKAMELAKGKMFFVVDSDDTLTSNCVETIAKWEQTIADCNEFAGLSGLKGYSENDNIGTTFAGEFLDLTTLQQRENNISGDRAEIFYTHILKKYRFPVFDGETFLTEKVLWNQLAYDNYKLRFFNEIIYLAEYLSDGLTKNYKKIIKRAPQGYAFSVLQDIEYYGYNHKEKQLTYYYYVLDLKDELSFKKAAKYLKIPSTYLIYIYYKYALKTKIKKCLTSGFR